MLIHADLHCHSTYSDGTLAPHALAGLAAAQGVDLWALTDHDTLAGQPEAREGAQAQGLAWVSGVEVSVSFMGQTIHIVGLGVDVQHSGLQALLAHNQASRAPRALAMGQALEAAGIHGAYAGALHYASSPAQLARTHFARYLVARGVCASVAQVFRHYLTPGKPGYVPQQWASLAQGVAQIRAAAGVAVLAHPGRYRLPDLQAHLLLDAFAAAGGQALEVATSAHSPAQVQHYAAVARQRGWWGACGSDFHGPQESRCALGAAPPLPAGVAPVWDALGAQIVQP